MEFVSVELTLREEEWKKICTLLVTVIFLYNYYSQLYYPSCKQVQ